MTPNGLLILILVPQNASPAQRGPRRKCTFKFKGKEVVAVISPLDRLARRKGRPVAYDRDVKASPECLEGVSAAEWYFD